MARQTRTMATLDFETDPFLFGRIPEPFAVGLYTGSDYIHVWGDDCVEKIAEVISEGNYKIYAHNGGKFDFFFLLPFLEPTLKIINGRIAKCFIGNSVLVDSWLILPQALGTMQKDEIDYKIMERGEREKPENKLKIQNYLQSDCVYLYNWVKAFLDRFGNKLTLAAAAFDQLEMTGYDCKQKSSENYDARFRTFYYGGRTQAFKKGFHKGYYKIFDINSAYPFAMLSEHPYGRFYCVKDKPKSLPKTLPYFATIRAISKGALPYREKDSVVYPDDDIVREYSVTGWEIQAGIDTSTLEIVEIIEYLQHDATNNFQLYVDKFYSEKVEGKKEKDKIKTIFAKYMLNGAYGKFGTDGRKYKKYRLTDVGELPLDEQDEAEMDLKGMSAMEYLDYKGWELEADTPYEKSIWCCPDPQDQFYNVATAASITGFVRAYLWRAICETDNVLYCDTDSIICKNFGGNVSATEIGGWDLEGETGKGVYIGGRKLYTMELLDGTIKKAHKGARLTHEQIIAVVEQGDVIDWKNDAPSFSLKMGTRFVDRKIKMT